MVLFGGPEGTGRFDAGRHGASESFFEGFQAGFRIGALRCVLREDGRPILAAPVAELSSGVERVDIVSEGVQKGGIAHFGGVVHDAQGFCVTCPAV